MQPSEEMKPEPVQDTWFTDRALPIMAISADIESDRVLKLHFRRPVSDDDRKALIDALNLHRAALAQGAVEATAYQFTYSDPERGSFVYYDEQPEPKTNADLTTVVPLYASPPREELERVMRERDEARRTALSLLAAEDERQDKLHELLETIREQIRLGVGPEHRPEGLFKNIQDAVYAMRGRTRLMDDAAIVGALCLASGGVLRTSPEYIVGSDPHATTWRAAESQPAEARAQLAALSREGGK